jgi:hypothetical protein
VPSRGLCHDGQCLRLPLSLPVAGAMSDTSPGTDSVRTRREYGGNGIRIPSTPGRKKLTNYLRRRRRMKKYDETELLLSTPNRIGK